MRRNREALKSEMEVKKSETQAQSTKKQKRHGNRTKSKQAANSQKRSITFLVAITKLQSEI